ASMDTLVIKAALTQEEAQLVHDHTPILLAADTSKGDGDPILVRLAGDINSVIPGTAEAIINSAQDTMHPSLLHNGGGEFAPDPTDPKGEHPLVKQFEVRIRVANPDGKYYPGQRAYVRMRVDKKPLIWRWTNKLLQ